MQCRCRPRLAVLPKRDGLNFQHLIKDSHRRYHVDWIACQPEVSSITQPALHRDVRFEEGSIGPLPLPIRALLCFGVARGGLFRGRQAIAIAVYVPTHCYPDDLARDAHVSSVVGGSLCPDFKRFVSVLVADEALHLQDVLTLNQLLHFPWAKSLPED